MKTNDCDCVILCGGQGKRLREIVHDVPKVMAQVDGRPFLDFVIEYLKSQGIARIILCTGYKADLIEEYYASHDFGLTIDFSTENKPLGTGGAVKFARERITSDPFFVLNGDSFLSADFQTLLDFHREKESLVTILVSKVNDSADFGTIKLNGDGKITEFQEKLDDPSETQVNAGVYCFGQAVFSHMPDTKKFSLEKEFFPKLVGGQLFGYCIDEEFVDIGTPERYITAKQKLEKG